MGCDGDVRAISRHDAREFIGNAKNWVHCDIAGLACHDVTIAGPAVYEDDCLELLDAGPITLQFDPVACDAAMGKPVLPETLSLRAVLPAGIDVGPARLD